MLPYFILIMVPFFIESLLICCNQTNQSRLGILKRNNAPIVVFFLLWFVMLAIRDVSCGIDLENYKLFFDVTKKMSFGEILQYYSVEQGFFLFNKLTSLIYPSFRFFLVVTALLSASLMCFFYKKESEYPLLTILLFVTNAMFPMFYSGLRQSLAMLFITPVYYFTRDRHLFLFLASVFIAQYFHSSAIILLLFYPIFHLPLKSKHFLGTILLVVVFFIFKIQLFSSILPFLGETYLDRYSTISDTGGYSILILLIIFLLYSFIIPDDKQMDENTCGLRNVLVLCCVIQCFAPINTIAMRMNYYFLLTVPLLIPRIMNRSSFENLLIVQYSKWIMVSFFSFYFFYNAFNSEDILQIYPYVPFWGID